MNKHSFLSDPLLLQKPGVDGRADPKAPFMVESSEETGRGLEMQPGMQAPYSLEMGSFPHFCKSLFCSHMRLLCTGYIYRGVVGHQEM